MKMQDSFQRAFGQLKAEEALKEKTKAFLRNKTNGYRKRYFFPIKQMATAACLILLLFVGGYFVYFTPVAFISLDINPSLELGVNRFSKVVSVESYNEEGAQLAASFSLILLDYRTAINGLLETEEIQLLLSRDELLSITITGEDEERNKDILTQVEQCTQAQKNIYCCTADSQELQEAHEAGLSVGKYRAFLQLQAVDPTVTPEDVQGMTMREIRERIAQKEQETGSSSEGIEKGKENGQGHRWGHQTDKQRAEKGG